MEGTYRKEGGTTRGEKVGHVLRVTESKLAETSRAAGVEEVGTLFSDPQERGIKQRRSCLEHNARGVMKQSESLAKVAGKAEPAREF